MELIADFLLLAASMSACLYCYVLSGRLRRLKSTRNGIASSLASLSKSVEEAQTTIAHAHLAAEKSVERLGPLLEKGGALEVALKNELNAVEAALDALIAARAEVLREQAAPIDAPEEAATEDAPPKDVAPEPTPADETEEAPEPETPPAEPKADKDPFVDPLEEATAAASPEASATDGDQDDFEIEWKPEDEAAERDVIELTGAPA
ncbi:MAG: hypothetical protein AAFX08_03550 [Pseudomonadota bacterium]